MCRCLKYDVDSYLYLRSDLISVYFTVIISFASQTYCLNYRLKYKVAASSQGVELKKSSMSIMFIVVGSDWGK